MIQYLLAAENREAIATHNEDLVVTTTKQIGKATIVTHDFNKQEEFRQLDTVLSNGPADALTVRDIARTIYGDDDEILTKRVRSNLKFNSPYQRTMTNGRAVLARQDGTLRITGSANEYGDLVEENTAKEVARIGKAVRQSAARMNKQIAAAVDKVPELGDRLADTRTQAREALNTVFSRQLELLSGQD